MQVEQRLGNREAQSHPIVTCADHRVEDLLLDFIRHTGSVVYNHDLYHQSVTCMSDSELAQDAGT